jgi:hypothetical protein
VLELAQVPVQILLVAPEIDDGISNQLPRSVKGDVAASLDLEHLDSPRRQEFRRGEKVFVLRRAAERDDGVMLEEEQDILWDRPRDAVTREIALELQRFGVRNAAERNGP